MCACEEAQGRRGQGYDARAGYTWNWYEEYAWYMPLIIINWDSWHALSSWGKWSIVDYSRNSKSVRAKNDVEMSVLKVRCSLLTSKAQVKSLFQQVGGGDGTARWLVGVFGNLKLENPSVVTLITLGAGNDEPFSLDSNLIQLELLDHAVLWSIWNR